MRIAVIANDTRGGVQPYAALAIGLRSAGHEVRVVAPADFAPMFVELELPMAPLAASMEADLQGATGATSLGPIASLRYAARELTPRMQGWTRQTLEACEGVDLLTGGIGGMVVGLSVADKLGVPFVPTHLQPIDAPTGDYPGALLSGMPRRLGRPGRLLSHHLSDLPVWTPFARPMATARREVLGLGGRSTAADGQPVLYGFSRLVVPLPTSGTGRTVTGYWFSTPTRPFAPPTGLEAFLADDRPVVSIGFGSMTDDASESLSRLVIDAVRSAGLRAVLLAGSAGLAPSVSTVGDDVFAVGSLPHDWLFPRVAAVVHHGGAGTTGAAFRAGVPQVVVPFTADQPFWGSRVSWLGVGVSPIPRRRLTVELLAEALRRSIEEVAIRRSAGAVGERIHAEDGIARAVEQFARLARPHGWGE